MSPLSLDDPAPPAPARRFVAPALFVGALFVTMWWREPPAAPAPDAVILTGDTMGTTFTVKVVVPTSTDAETAAMAAMVRAELDAVDGAMSTWKPDSELSRLNRHGLGEPFGLGRPLWEVLRIASDVHRGSNGAFDPTVGPLVRAWGFGPDGRDLPAPDGPVLDALRARVGWAQLDVDASRPLVVKSSADVEVDLSAVAKGYGVDQVSMALTEAGWTDHMVEVGGEVRVSGHGPAGGAWRIGLEVPTDGARVAGAVLPLSHGALATSGDYRNFIEVDGLRRSHTIDPRTGQPVTHSTASVSVLHDACGYADAWATALLVLGADEGLPLAESAGVASRFLVRDADGFTEHRTSAWDRRQPAATPETR